MEGMDVCITQQNFYVNIHMRENFVVFFLSRVDFVQSCPETRHTYFYLHNYFADYIIHFANMYRYRDEDAKNIHCDY